MLQVFELEPFLSDLIDSIRSERALGSAALDEAETADICALAKLIEGRPSSAVRPRPLYLRAPDAKTIAERLAAQT
jgi:tRNA A37 threonylcarbamoyladenosine modification protein TsaB